MSDIASKDYLIDEIRWRLEELRKETIADADEILQYFTRVMRGEVKDQFGLDAPLSERTSAAKELAKRVIDVEKDAEAVVPEIKITLNWSNSGTE
jgi:phage terminase small subunit